MKSQAHHDYITTEILDRNLGWPYMAVVDYIVKPCFNTWFWCAAQFWDLLDGNKVRAQQSNSLHKHPCCEQASAAVSRQGPA